MRFSGERRGVHTNAKGFEQAAVCRHVVARTEKDHVAGHELFGWDHDHGAITQSSDLMRQQSLQRRHRFLGAILLPEREPAVDEDDGENRQRERGHPLARHLHIQNERQEGSHPQKTGEEMCELRDESDEQRYSRQLFDPVWPEFEPPRCGLLGRQSGWRATQRFEGRVDGGWWINMEHRGDTS